MAWRSASLLVSEASNFVSVVERIFLCRRVGLPSFLRLDRQGRRRPSLLHCFFMFPSLLLMSEAVERATIATCLSLFRPGPREEHKHGQGIAQTEKFDGLAEIFQLFSVPRNNFVAFASKVGLRCNACLFAINAPAFAHWGKLLNRPLIFQ